MRDGVRRLAAEARLEVRDEVEPSLVVGAMVATAQRHDAQRALAAAEAARDEVRRVDRRARAADDARRAAPRTAAA
jgi:hypothetical protein